MGDAQWKEIAAHLAETTTFSERQAEVFTLEWLCWYNRDTIADKLNITPTTVRRHKENITEKVDHSRNLIHAYDNSPFCRPCGDASFTPVAAFLYENTLVPSGNHDSPSERFFLELRRRERAGEDERARIEETRTEYRFASVESILDALRTGEFSMFREAACVYSALTEAVEETRELPALGAILDTDPEKGDMHAALEQGIISPKDVQPFVQTAHQRPGQVIGTHLGTDIDIPFDLRDGNVTCIAGDIGSGKSYTGKTLLHRFRQHVESPPAIICIDLLHSFSEFITATNGTEYTVSDDAEELESALQENPLEDLSRINIDSNSTSPTETLDCVIDIVLEALNSTRTPGYIVIDEARMLSNDTIRTLLAETDDPASELVSWMYIGQTFGRDSGFETLPFTLEQAGVIVHKLANLDGLEKEMTAGEREFVRNARSGKADGPKQALVSPAGNSTWMPVEMEMSLSEIATVTGSLDIQ